MVCIANPESDDEEYVKNCHNYKAVNGTTICSGCDTKFYL